MIMSQNIVLPTLTVLQSQLYRLLLNKGEVSAAELLESSSFKRATLYKTLYELEEKGLISKRDIKKKLSFKPESPVKLMEGLNFELERLERGKNTLEFILPQLTAAYTTSTLRPVVHVYQGEEGIKKANLEILAEKQKILAYVYVDPSLDERLSEFWKKYYSIRKRDKIFVNAIVPATKEGRAFKARDSEELRTTKLIAEKRFPLRIEKNIVGNKVAFFSWDKDNLIATIIENKLIAEAERAIFDLIWSSS